MHVCLLLAEPVGGKKQRQSPRRIRIDKAPIVPIKGSSGGASGFATQEDHPCETALPHYRHPLRALPTEVRMKAQARKNT